MMMLEHTPEPWSLFGIDKHIMGNSLVQSEKLGVAHAQWTHNCSDEDARRIVACVNACKGIKTEDLELVPNFSLTGTATIEKVEQQRDELLAAIKAYFTDYMADEAEDAGSCCSERQHLLAKAVQAAIAKADQ